MVHEIVAFWGWFEKLDNQSAKSKKLLADPQRQLDQFVGSAPQKLSRFADKMKQTLLLHSNLLF